MTPNEQLKIVIVGHVDHGKSTFVGRLFHETGSLPEGKLEQLQRIAERRGVPFEWANLMDALQSERDQNITIDTAQIWFQTKQRQYVLIDAPGHKEFLKNMITGAASAEAALLLVDAKEGVQEQSRRHGYLLHLLGIKQVAVLVNKMDLEEYSQERFERVEKEFRKFLESIGVKPRFFVPISAKNGENLATISPNMAWWTGPTVIEALDSFICESAITDKPLRYVVQDVYRFDERRILAGRVESGSLKVGDKIVFSPGNRVSTIKTIECWSASALDVASTGQSVGLTLIDQLFVERGAIGTHETAVPFELTEFKARLFWLGRKPFSKGRLYKLKLGTQEVECEIADIEKIIDASSLNPIEHPAGQVYVARHEVAELSIRTRRPVAFDLHSEIPATGRFVIVDGFEVSGGGIIVEDAYPHRTSDTLHKSRDIFWTDGDVTRAQRTVRNGHPGCVIWLTGLTGSGKSTISRELERQFFKTGKQVYVLDGDRVRHGLSCDLAFSPDDRSENIRRVGEVAKLFADAGLIVISAFISPYRADRDHVRGSMNDLHFVEVFLDCPPDVCERRDKKGLYAKARSGEIKDFTGVSAPYEPPLQPELQLKTHELSVDDAVGRVMDYVAALK
jgi:bifunctional enzyme CysN/CysC